MPIVRKTTNFAEVGRTQDIYLIVDKQQRLQLLSLRMGGSKGDADVDEWSLEADS